MSETIDLNSNQPNVQNIVGQDDPEQINRIETAIGDLSSLLGPGSSNDDIVDSILQASEESLIPWEECTLPSRGLYYDWPDGTVMVRAMNQTAEKVLATQRLAQSGQSIDYLFRECCKFPAGFDSTELLLGDRVFLLYFIRGITHGNNYEFAVTCPNQSCEAVSTHTYDLNELARTITWAKTELGSEPFKISLPYFSKVYKKDIWVGIKFLRAYDANDMLAKRKARKKMFARPGGGVKNRNSKNAPVNVRQQQSQSQVVDDTISENMSKIIVSINGVADQFKIRQVIDKMHAQDTAAIREWLRDNTPGIDNTVTVECPECSHEYTMELPITENFFRPSKR